MLLLAVVFALLQLANVTGRDTPDSKNYVSYALSLGGASKREAAAATIDWACSGDASIARRNQSVNVNDFHGADPTRRVLQRCRTSEWGVVERRMAAGQTTGHTVPFMPARFMRIFEVRPGYPAFLLPFVTVLGVTWGVWLASVAVAVAGGILVFLILRTLSVSAPLALTGQALYYVLPCGTTAMRPMTEGLMLALTLTAVWGCALSLTGRPRPGTALVGGALLALFTVKHSQSLFLGLCVAAAGTAVAVRRRRRGRVRGRGVVAVTAAGCCAALGTVLLARLLHYPSETESLQDLLTGHFSRPDRAHPWAELLHLEGNFWLEWARRQLRDPLFAVALAAGAWGALRRPAFGTFLLAAAFTGILTQAGHPDINIWGERLIVLAWVLPVVGLPLLLEPVSLRGLALPAQGHGERRDVRVTR
ncbi:hypothetical protein GCM10010121_031940 [Streptomyces brasiliensis]|uniref:Uncharacterized protein n=1 Tax=Streptomyces brasiliensis TaxID=1954 RepID=A0A917KKX8_9ACTN|nr:hypothetical protein GCM10010121_031940 [Streptomyces brasiliensis]